MEVPARDKGNSDRSREFTSHGRVLIFVSRAHAQLVVVVKTPCKHLALFGEHSGMSAAGGDVDDILESWQGRRDFFGLLERWTIRIVAVFLLQIGRSSDAKTAV